VDYFALVQVRLGALADFLSRPILVGFLNGIALSILVGQLGKVLGISARGNGIVSQLLGTFEALPQAHLLTVGVSFASLALLFSLLHGDAGNQGSRQESHPTGSTGGTDLAFPGLKRRL